jgi:ParB/RepB/Spo0J family partition protein
MTSRELEAGDLSVAQPAAAGHSPDVPPASVRELARTSDARVSFPQRLAIAQIDLRFDKLRLPSPQEMRRLQASIQSEGRIREPLLVSTGVEERLSVLVDGFKRLRAALDLGITDVWVHAVQLDAAQAKAAILQYNQAREGLCEIEEAWIVHSLRHEHGLQQIKIAEVLRRRPSWVCRRLQLAEELDESLQKDVRLGLLCASTARELVQLPRGNQVQAAQAVRDHQLSSRQCIQLVQRLRDPSANDPQVVRELLEDPLRYLAPGSLPRPKRAVVNDPRLSEAGNRLRQVLTSWQDSCGRLSLQLRHRPTSAEGHVLAPQLQNAVHTCKRLLKQLEAIHSTCNSQPPAPQNEPPRAQEDADA